jgi:hypothetical protein
MWDEACDFEHELSHFRDNLSKFENATDGEMLLLIISNVCILGARRA